MTKKNILEGLVPSKHNSIDRNYNKALDESLPSTTTGITGPDIFTELTRLINERSDRDLLPDGNVFTAIMVDSVELKSNSAHACMVPRDLWNAYAQNPSGYSMYKCRVAIDFRDCIKPAPSHIAKSMEDMSTRDVLRSKSYSLAYGMFAKPPQPGEQYDVRILNKTKHFCGDEIIALDKKGTYEFEKQKSMKQTLAMAGTPTSGTISTSEYENDDQGRPGRTHEEVYGKFSYTEGPRKGEITINPEWIKENIVQVEFDPINKEHKNTHRTRMHKKLAASFSTTLAAASKASGYYPKSIASFVPRHKTWNPNRGLSKHSWGIAFDVDPTKNPYGRAIGPLYTESGQRFVRIFEQQGWIWGGRWKNKPDPMHFEKRT